MSYDLMLNKAIALHNEGALNSARDIYVKILEVAPYNADVWNLLGLVSQSKADDVYAVDCFLSAIKYSPKPFAPYFFNLGLSYKSLDKKAEAIDALLKATKIAPDMKEAWNYLGILYEDDFRHEDGIKCFCKALELDNDYKEARANLCFYSNDKKSLIKLIDEDETDFNACYLLAKMCDDLDDKESYFRKAFDICPYRVDVILCLAKVLKDKSKLKESLVYYHKALNVEDDNIEAMLGVADINLEFNEFEKAEYYYKKSLDFRRDLFGVYLNYGSLLYKTKRYNEALLMYREAVRLNPEDCNVSYNLALILKDIGESEEALGLMFNAYLKDKENEGFQIGIMETISELFDKNAELALKIAQNWYNVDKDNIFSKRLLSALSGAELENNDNEYAKKLFDKFADNYDDTMQKIDYFVIDKFIELNKDISGNVLELGCGTGALGKALVGKIKAIDGVDISSNMIKKAKNANAYKELYVSELVDFVKNKDLSLYDLVVALDVFCYMGNLKSVLSELKGKEVWFSVEKADIERGKDFYLATSGRYKHSISYIKKIADELDFQEFQSFNIVLRKENNNPIEGYLFKLK